MISMRNLSTATALVTVLLAFATSGVYNSCSTSRPLYRTSDFSLASLNCTLAVDGTDILFIGQDIGNEIEQYFGGLMDNATAATLIQQYYQELLFIRRSARDGYVLIAGMNESSYTEILFECTLKPEEPRVKEVVAVEVFSGVSYLESLKSALSTAIQENATRRLNITSWVRCDENGGPPLQAYLWSQNYTGDLFYSDRSVCRTIWSHPDSVRLLSALHWEIGTWSYVQQMECPTSDPAEWRTVTILAETIVSITMDGDLIEVVAVVYPVSTPWNAMPYILAGSLAAVAVATLAAVMRRRRQAYDH